MMKYTISSLVCFLWVCLLALTSCHDDKPETPLPGEKSISFQLEIVNGTNDTRMDNDEEEDIKTVYILAFTDSDKKFSFGALADKASGNDNIYKVDLPNDISAGTSMFFALLINYTPSSTLKASFAGKTYTNVLNELVIEKDDLPNDCIPMFGVTTAGAISAGLTFNDVKLIRMLARITVVNENGDLSGDNGQNFELIEIGLTDAPTAGYLGYDVDAGIKNTGVADYFYTNPYPWQTSPIIGFDDFNTVTTGNSTVATGSIPKKESAGPIYTFERPEPATDECKTYLRIVGRYYGVKGDKTPVKHTYNVELPALDYTKTTIPFEPNADPDAKKHILRNHHYTVRIQRAYPLDLTFLITVVPWTEDVILVDDILDKTYTMQVDPLETILEPLEVNAKKDISFYSDYMWDYKIYEDKDCKNQVKEEDAWININIPIEKNFKGKDDEDYYPATGKINIEVSTGSNFDAPRTYYIKFIGYGTDEAREDIVYESVSLLATITQRNFNLEESNCYVIDNTTPTEFAIPISRIGTAITDGVIADNIDTWIPVADRDNNLKAQVYWTDRQLPGNSNEGLFGDDNSVIKSLKYVADATDFYKGYIHIIPGKGIGNAGVILYLDKNGTEGYQYGTDDKICWSWHIWNTYRLVEVGTNGFLDRNLGAHRPEPGDLSSVGFFYQWGRKDPLPGLASWKVWTGAEANPHIVKFFFNPDKDNGTYTLANISQPVSSPTIPDQGWASKAATGSWNDKESTNPCPVGYKVADSFSASGWASKVGDFYANNNDEEYGTGYIYGQYNATNGGYYPAAGYGFDTGLSESSTNGYYWSSAGTTLEFSASAVSDNNTTLTKEKGTPIRCVKKK